MNTFRVSDKYGSKSDAHMKRWMCAVDETIPSELAITMPVPCALPVQLRRDIFRKMAHSLPNLHDTTDASHLPKWTYTWQLETGLPRRRGLLWKYFIPQFCLIFFSWGITSLAFILRVYTISRRALRANGDTFGNVEFGICILLIKNRPQTFLTSQLINWHITLSLCVDIEK